MMPAARTMHTVSAVLAVLGLAVAPASAQWVERPFDPPPGSRWLVESVTEASEGRPDGKTQTMRTKSRSELSVEEKTADGFRVVYRTRDMEADGSAPSVKVVAPLMSLVKNVTVRATLDKNGKLVRVDNAQELREVIQRVIERSIEPFKNNPKIAAIMREMLTGMLQIDGPQGGQFFLEDLTALADGHNTGLKIGEVRRTSEEVASPFGGGTIRADVTTRIAEADPKTGRVRLVRARTLDPASLKEITLAFVRKLGIAAGKTMPPEVERMIKTMSLAIEGETEIVVEGGMVRTFHERSITKGSMMGQGFRKEESKTITVSPLL